jgi:acyl-CoA synthetase (AMP-forming)/AMP-acid ligase II
VTRNLHSSRQGSGLEAPYDSLSVRSLEDLSRAFELLEQGRNVLLLSSGCNPGSIPPTVSFGPWLGLTSSGSTGLPKTVWVRWESLKARVSPSTLYRHWIWASPFLPSTYAGVQVALQAWHSSGRVVQLGLAWPDCARCILEERVDALSCTPTFIDLLMQNASDGPSTGLDLKQITLGGEPLRPRLGVRLLQRFPRTRFTVLYASAELGLLMRTHRLDGWYESSSLSALHPRWSVREGQLFVFHNGEWRGTGDLVEFATDLVRVIGRADAVVNVAGVKVSLAEVTDLAEGVPGVRRAQAFARPNAVTGQVVGLRYSFEGSADPTAMLEVLQLALRKRLRKEAWPRIWEMDSVDPVNNAKRALR